MDADNYSKVHFFETLKDAIVSQPYAILCYEEMNELINQIAALVEGANPWSTEIKYACALRQAVDNAMSDGYFPIVVLPAKIYKSALSHLGAAQK